MTRSLPIPILFTHYGDSWIRGSEQLLLDLLARLDRQRVRPVVWCNAAEMADAVRGLGITAYRSDFELYFDYLAPRFRLGHYRSLMREAHRLIGEHEIRVLHSNSAAPCQWLAPVARQERLPLLAHLHIGYLRRSRYVFLLHQASLVVGVSRQVVEPFLDDGLAAERTHVIYNGIDFARLRRQTDDDPRRRLGIADDAVVISAIGSLIQRKGQDVLIRAFSRLDATRNIQLLVVSDGPERQKLEQLTAELGLQRRIRFLGYYDDLVGVYAASDIVALASRADAFGLVLAEAGYFGLPVVATAVGGIPEVVEHGATGLLVPPDDPAALSTALARLIDDRDYRERLGRAGKKRVERLFGVERMVADFHEAYDRLDRMPRHRLGWLDSAQAVKPYLRLIYSRRASR
ncbi:MAG TPA: glycosyltransferase family 4 protein [Stellaceae bacterium]|nr:glycosyltransferase family 4 protein [Stellaceae bacterium]